jgi:hypothetical protein
MLLAIIALTLFVVPKLIPGVFLGGILSVIFSIIV